MQQDSKIKIIKTKSTIPNQYYKYKLRIQIKNTKLKLQSSPKYTKNSSSNYSTTLIQMSFNITHD